MSDGNQASSQDAVARYLAPGGDNVKLVYVLYLASVLVGLTVLIGLVMAYVNRPQVRGTWVESHYTYQIRTFWIGLVYSLACVLLMVVGVGFLLIIAVAVWAIVRCIKGLQWVAAGQPVPDPQSWIV
jgi:uncharacterized membrane protein